MSVKKTRNNFKTDDKNKIVSCRLKVKRNFVNKNFAYSKMNCSIISVYDKVTLSVSLT